MRPGFQTRPLDSVIGRAAFTGVFSKTIASRRVSANRMRGEACGCGLGLGCEDFPETPKADYSTRMPANLLHSLFHRVENGWDPISPVYAGQYDQVASSQLDRSLISRLAALSGGLAGKRVLDLGGGPGHYTVLFAELGAQATWHDVSREYQRLAQRRAEACGVTLQFSLGYLEDAAKFGENCFDLVFCRVCWYYSRSDRAFARLLHSLVRPGGLGYVECNTPAFARAKGIRRLQYWLNNHLWWKIGHPMPPRGRIAGLLQNYENDYLELDYRSDLRDIVLFIKAPGSPRSSTMEETCG